MKKTLVLALLATLTAPLFAKTLTFKFRVNSSGPEIYACNAGLRHLPFNGKICYDPDYPEVLKDSCAPNDIHCECTGTGGGAYLMDGMRFTTTPWAAEDWDNDHMTSAAKQAGNNAFNMIVSDTNPNKRFGTKLDSVTFELGSEIYGAEYFIDICFKGSQIDYYDPNPALQIPTSNSLAAKVSASDIIYTSGLSYLNLAKPMGRAVTICDTQTLGSYKFGGENQGVGPYDTFSSDINFSLIDAQLNNMSNATIDFGAAGDKKFTSALTTVQTTTASWLNGKWINQNNTEHPRFCVTRYYFKESNLIPRKWQRHDAIFTTETTIEEAAE